MPARELEGVAGGVVAAPGRARDPLYRGYRFPAEIISYAVWLYYPFLLSYCDVEELLVERGIAVSYETVRPWCQKFGQTFADGVRRVGVMVLRLLDARR